MTAVADERCPGCGALITVDPDGTRHWWHNEGCSYAANLGNAVDRIVKYSDDIFAQATKALTTALNQNGSTYTEEDAALWLHGAAVRVTEGIERE